MPTQINVWFPRPDAVDKVLVCRTRRRGKQKGHLTSPHRLHRVKILRLTRPAEEPSQANPWTTTFESDAELGKFVYHVLALNRNGRVIATLSNIRSS